MMQNAETTEHRTHGMKCSPEGRRQLHRDTESQDEGQRQQKHRIRMMKDRDDNRNTTSTG